MRKARDAQSDVVSALRKTISDIEAEPYEVTTAELELPEAVHKLEKCEATLKQQEKALGVEGRTQYRHLASSPFISARMNAKAVKLRLREKLRSRKFERDRLERSFRRQMNSKFFFLDEFPVLIIVYCSFYTKTSPSHSRCC